MCGIVGYVGKKEALPVLIEGLRRESYRGYDSSGIVVFKGKKSTLIKAVGKLENLKRKLRGKKIEGNIGLGHSRWATHGKVNEVNAHPHQDCKGNIFLVHNGIVENYKQLKEKLKKNGHKFLSQTDSEVLVHLIEHFFQGNLENAVLKALKLVRGSYGLAVICRDDPGKIVVARNSSPLLIGVGEGENLVASDASAVLGHTRRIIYLKDKEIGILKPDSVKVVNIENQILEKDIQQIDWKLEQAQKEGFPHFMLKEIYETPEAARNAMRGRVNGKNSVELGGLEDVREKISHIKRLVIIACGTSYFAGLVGKYMIEEYVGIPTEVEYASEFRHRKPVLDKEGSMVLAISQSGETADTLAAVREAKKQGASTLGIINVVGSSIAREVDVGIYNYAGPEIGVASTKALVSQLVVLVLLTLFLGEQKGMSSVVRKKILTGLQEIPVLLRGVLKLDKKIEKIAQKYKKYPNFLYIGRKYSYPVALEGALKLKEVSYVHSEGYAAGEMKHGPIALIDKYFPTIVIAPDDSVYEKTLSNMSEIKTRNGPIIVLTTEGDKNIKALADDIIYVQRSLEMLNPILYTVVLQLFAYHMGIIRGYDVDKPRNLAKSVTVE